MGALNYPTSNPPKCTQSIHDIAEWIRWISQSTGILPVEWTVESTSGSTTWIGWSGFQPCPPVVNKPLYFDGPLKDLHEVSGQTAYRAFNHTVFLKKVQRQQGDDQAGFRLALSEVRGLKLSVESWKLLSQRVRVKLSQREVDTFDAALRIYSKKARVDEYNYEHLIRLKHPAIKVMEKNIGNGADKVTSE
ncbi:hypothetical protein FOMA001_g12972 [Fusarium oxysporum f. sp. matthiolae]|nr:hypothetical protein FOMA001_g12972 [Fusarium oxysporum f. sp. matthiolae]